MNGMAGRLRGSHRSSDWGESNEREGPGHVWLLKPAGESMTTLYPLRGPMAQQGERSEGQMCQISFGLKSLRGGFHEVQVGCAFSSALSEMGSMGQVRGFS